ncbi:MAG: hypothetical protein Q7U99_08565 [Rubrivivax sp.]|nr:hypothetical protein [Rubrivivax sp.]MDP3226050.1 hypothetical protein [Rubrivivax sp.]
MRAIVIAVLAVLAVLAGTAHASTCQASSGAIAPTVVELYTSEG